MASNRGAQGRAGRKNNGGGGGAAAFGSSEPGAAGDPISTGGCNPIPFPGSQFTTGNVKLANRQGRPREVIETPREPRTREFLGKVL
jgi:hypothetical protein